MRIRFVEELVQSFPPGMEGWTFHRIEYGDDSYHLHATGHVWLPPGVRPESPEGVAQTLAQRASEDQLMDAIVNAVDELSVAENDGDVREAVETLCKEAEIKSPYEEEEEEES